MTQYRIKIQGIPYTIWRVDDWRMVQHGESDGPLWGEISYRERSIRIKACCQENELRTTLHEIIHGIVELGGIRELKDEHGNHLEDPINQLANGLAESLESIGISSLLMQTSIDQLEASGINTEILCKT